MAIRVDGKSLARSILNEVRKDSAFSALQRKTLLVISVDPSSETVRFIEAKRKIAEDLGIGFSAETLPSDIDPTAFAGHIRSRVYAPDIAGIIIQLPLPTRLDVRQVFNALPVSKDVDVLSEAAFHNYFFNESPVIPPVTGAIDRICQEYRIDVKGKFVAILGAGKLIGAPTLAWFAKQGAQVCSFCDSASTICNILQQADIVVSGIGKPGYVTGAMLKPGVVVFDAGFTVAGGKVLGDFSKDALEGKASLYT
ncbi:MAG: bifunctional 5,10-methylene-tetrahydrofolate dehydrogenase/ 5,10-methylene-tetrahydrofolate cyclohydrolase, partial [Parcubacteria group bacterium GW2011_GWF1_45_5]